MGGKQCEVALKALEGFTPRPNRQEFPYVEYRGRGGAEYRHVVNKKHWPNDDLTFRLVDGYWALVDAGCPQPVAVLARRMRAITGKEWTRNEIESRLNPHKKTRPSSWLNFPWRERYWLYLNRASKQSPRCGIDQPFVFTWSDGSQNREPEVKGHNDSKRAPWVAGMPTSGAQ
jgi:hypothetical protein